MAATEVKKKLAKKSKLRSGTHIEGVNLKPLLQNKDSRGSFTEVFQSNWNTCIEPVQWSFVESIEKSLRGMHLHRRHDEYFCCLQGSCIVSLLDLRPVINSMPDEIVPCDKLSWSTYILHGEDLAALTFPAGILHGWYFHEDSLHIQAVSEAYDTYSADDNLGVHWDDPALPFDWPFENCLVSPRAADFDSLSAMNIYLQKCS